MKTIAAVKNDKKIYYSPMYLNGVFSLDLESENSVKCLNIFSKEEGCQHLYRRAYSYKNDIWFVPQNAKNVAKYNIVNNEIETFDYPYHKQFNNGMFKYSDSFVFNEKYLCLVPGNTDAIVIIDMETSRERIIYDVVDPENESYVSGAYANGSIWLCPFNSVDLRIVDLERNYIHNKRWKHNKESFDGVCSVNDVLYFAPFLSNVFYSIDTKDMVETEIDLSRIKNQNEKFQGIFKHENQLWCMPFTAKYFLIFDLQNGEILKEVTKDFSIFENWEWETNNYMPVSLEEDLILASCFPNGFHLYNKRNNVFDFIEISNPNIKNDSSYENSLKQSILSNILEQNVVKEVDDMLECFCRNCDELQNIIACGGK